ncbi:hypothetical protein [Virgibacillus ndiopensis]|nr:hypothetical protein [Virgibacillus ndiopensis]
MKKKNNDPELATYTILNPDFHTVESQLNTDYKSDENHENTDVSTKLEQ